VSKEGALALSILADLGGDPRLRRRGIDTDCLFIPLIWSTGGVRRETQHPGALW
jgi:hypothetical protein